MAQQMVCDGCESEPAVLLLTNIGTGDVQAIGAECLPTWLRSMADAMDAAAAPHDEPVPYLPTDSASPQYDPDSGTLRENPATPAPAPPQPTTDPDARGEGHGTTDHGYPVTPPPEQAPAEPAEPAAPATEPETPPAPADNPADPAPADEPVPDNAPGQLAAV